MSSVHLFCFINYGLLNAGPIQFVLRRTVVEDIKPRPH